MLSPGELGPNTGYGINFGAGCEAIHLVFPNQAGVGGSLGYMNNVTYTPQIFDQGRSRVYASRSDQTYYHQLKSVFTYGQSLEEHVKGGGSEQLIRTWGDAAGQKLQFMSEIGSTATWTGAMRG